MSPPRLPAESPATPVAASAVEGKATRAPGFRPTVSAWNLLVIAVIALGMAISAHANIDGDIFWHRVLGQHWLDQGSLDLSSDPIAYTDGIRDWFPTAWLPEVLYAGLVSAFGYDGILGLRFVLATAFYLLLLRQLSAHHPAWLRAFMLLVVGVPASLVLQDRPQTMSLVICAASLPALHRWYVENETPRLVSTVALTWLWANLHGLWVLVPGFLMVIAVCDLSGGDRRWRRYAGGSLLCLAVAGLTPVGPRLLGSPFLVGSSAEAISEWHATALRSPVAWGLALTLLILFTGMSRAPSVPRRHIISAVAGVAFGLTAYRNAVVASVVLLPLTAHYTALLLPSVRTTIRVPRRVVYSVGGLTFLWLGSLYAGQSAISDHVPARIAEALRTYPSVRVLATYNSSGYLREFGGEGVRVAIDGRADRYGADRIREHLSLMAGEAGWRRSLARLDPDVVVVHKGSALRELLIQDGWQVTARDGVLVMLTH